MPNASSRYGQTVYLPELQGSRAVPLQRRRLTRKAGEDSYDEDWLQLLLYQTPEILPTGEFDPVFAPAMPLCRELPTDAGPIDLAYVSDQGRLSIVECKLWRNPEARRDAVSQILDYAKEISRWSYEELNDAVRQARSRDKHPNASLFELVREQNDTIDEKTFVDDVTRSLANGHFLLLVVGDGIREGVERIADYLSQSAGLRFTFGLVELAIFDMPAGSAGGIIVEPRVIAKTVEIERAVVRRADASVVVEDPPATPGGKGRKGKITKEEFFEQIKQVDPALPDRICTFFQRCKDHGLEVTLGGASFILHWYRQNGRKVNFGTLLPTGELDTNFVVWNAEECGNPQVGVDYLEAVAKLIPDATVKKEGNYWTWRVIVHGKKPTIASVIERSGEWLNAIDRSIDAFNRLDER